MGFIFWDLQGHTPSITITDLNHLYSLGLLPQITIYTLEQTLVISSTPPANCCLQTGACH